MVGGRCEAALLPSDLHGHRSDRPEQFSGQSGILCDPGRRGAERFGGFDDLRFCSRLVPAGTRKEQKKFPVELRKFNRIVIVSFLFVRYAYVIEHRRTKVRVIRGKIYHG